MNKLLTALTLAAACSMAGAAAPPVKRRLPAVAGQFYPAKAQDLSELVARQFATATASALPAGAEIMALLVPHAGLEFSGVTAARAFKLLRRGAFDRVVVVGTCHYKELAGAAIYPGGYGTTEGYLAFDSKLAAALSKASPLIKEDASAHTKEHSIEVEIPFLRRALGPVPLTALVMNTQDLEAAREIGHAIARVVKGQRALLVASSDLSHYPSGGVAEAVDRTTLAALQTLDPAYFWLTNRFLMNRALPQLAVAYCGEGAVTAVLMAARDLGANGARVLSHINSGDVVSERDYDHVVGYAAVAFTREPGASPSRPALSAKQKKRLLEAARASVSETAAGRGVAAPLSADPAFNLPAAVFVTLNAKDGALRGCTGTIEPQESLLEAVVRQASAAASQDKRFSAVTVAEATSLKIEVSVLSPLHPVKAEQIVPGDGVIVEQDGRRGVFLPDVWKQLPDKERFLGELCSQKAGLARDCWQRRDAGLKRFSVVSFSD